MIDEGIYTQTACTHYSLSHNFTVVMIRSGFASALFSHHVNVVPSLFDANRIWVCVFLSSSLQTTIQLYTHITNLMYRHIYLSAINYKLLDKSLCLLNNNISRTTHIHVGYALIQYAEYTRRLSIKYVTILHLCVIYVNDSLNREASSIIDKSALGWTRKL